MARTLLPGRQVTDGSIQRVDLDTTTAGSAIIARVIAGTNISLSSTGADAGTGDVTVSFSGTLPIASGGTGATTASAARTALSAAVSGVNGDITSLTGLTTALSIAQGGTGSTTAAAARTALGLGTAATLTAGTGANNVVQLNASGKLPAIDGSQLTNLASNPTGTIIIFAASTPPTGYLKANGALVSRTTYAALFAVIGTTFGAGDGSTTFALPDLRGEFVRGWDDGRSIDSGRAFGSAQADAFQSHYHTITGTVGGAGSGSVGFTDRSEPRGPVASGYTGGAETRPRNIALLACIKY